MQYHKVLKGENYNYTADIWSLGCIFHELCCLKPPFFETDIFKFIDMLKKEEYNSDEIPDEYDPNIKTMITSMLNFNRRLRPSCDELLENVMFRKHVELFRKRYENEYGDKSSYEGEMKDEKKHGKEVYHYVNGTKYEGEWKYDRRNGKGSCNYPHGRKYDGEWKDNERHGQGVVSLVVLNMKIGGKMIK